MSACRSLTIENAFDNFYLLYTRCTKVTLQNALNELREVGQLIINGDEEKLKSQVRYAYCE